MALKVYEHYLKDAEKIIGRKVELNEFENNPDLVVKFINNFTVQLDFAKNLSDKLMDNFDVVFAGVKKYWRFLYYASDRLKDNREIVLESVKYNGLSLKFANDRFRDDKEVVLTAIKNDPHSLIYASSNLKENGDFLIEAYKTTKRVEKYFDPKITNNVDFKNKFQITKKEEENKKVINQELLSKLKKKYYKSYLDIVVSKDSKKDNDLDFYKCMIKSNVLDNIYKMNDFTVADVRAVETACHLLFSKEEEKELINRIKKLTEKYKNINFTIYNNIVKNRNNKKELDQILQFDELKLDNVVNYIINNKYYDSNMKTTLLSIVYEVYDPKKIIRVQDIFEMLAEMNERGLTIEEILKEKNINVRDFYKIYEVAKENNPVLFNGIKESLQINKIRGFKKFLARGYIVLNTKEIIIDEFEEKYKMSIYEFLNSYRGTELYSKLLEKFSKIENFDIEKVENINVDKTESDEENVSFGI